MEKARRMPWRSYSIAVLTVAVALLLTRLFEPLNEHTPLALFFAAAAVSAWHGGLWPGLLATGLGALTVVVFVLPSPYSWIIDSWDKAIALGAGNRLQMAYFDRGLARDYLGDMRGAYFDYRKAIEIDPEFAPAKEQLARFTVTIKSN